MKSTVSEMLTRETRDLARIARRTKNRGGGHWVRLVAALVLAMVICPLDALICRAQSEHEKAKRPKQGAAVTQEQPAAGIEARLTEVLKMAASGSPEAKQSLVSALNDPAPIVRAAAVSGLASLGDKASIPAIGTILEKDKDEFVRRQAAYALGELRDSASTPYLLGALRDKRVEVKSAAIVSLGQYPCPEAVPIFIIGLQDKSPFIRAESARALGLNVVDSQSSTSALVRVLDGDPSQDVRRQAARALGQIGNPAALSSLESAARSSNPYLSADAISAIEAIRDRGRRR